MSIFEAIKIADTLEEAVRDTLMLWFPTYLKEFELQSGLIPNSAAPDKLPLPRTVVIANDMDQEAADQLPAIVIVSPGMSPRRRPIQEGDGTFRCFWGIGVGVFASGPDRGATGKLIRYYAAIVRTILLQNQSLGGVSDGCEWFDESYDDAFSFADNKTIGAGQVVFEFEMAGVVSRYGGPAKVYSPWSGPDPVNQPGSNWPTVQKHKETVKVKP